MAGTSDLAVDVRVDTEEVPKTRSHSLGGMSPGTTKEKAMEMAVRMGELSSVGDAEYTTAFGETVKVRRMQRRRDQAIKWFNVIFDWKWYIFPFFLACTGLAVGLYAGGLIQVTHRSTLSATFLSLVGLNLLCSLSACFLVFKLGSIDATITEVERLCAILEEMADELKTQANNLEKLNDNLETQNKEYETRVDELQSGIDKFSSLMEGIESAFEDMKDMNGFVEAIKERANSLLNLAKFTQRAQFLYYFIREAISDGTFSLSRSEYQFFLTYMDDDSQRLWSSSFDFGTVAGKSGEPDTIEAENFYECLDSFVNDKTADWIQLNSSHNGGGYGGGMTSLSMGSEIGSQDTFDPDTVLEAIDDAVMDVMGPKLAGIPKAELDMDVHKINDAISSALGIE